MNKQMRPVTLLSVDCVQGDDLAFDLLSQVPPLSRLQAHLHDILVQPIKVALVVQRVRVKNQIVRTNDDGNVV